MAILKFTLKICWSLTKGVCHEELSLHNSDTTPHACPIRQCALKKGAALPVTELAIKELKSTVKENGAYVYWNMTNIAALAGVEKVVAGTYTYNAETATWAKV